jgi:hypothetical protein
LSFCSVLPLRLGTMRSHKSQSRFDLSVRFGTAVLVRLEFIPSFYFDVRYEKNRMSCRQVKKRTSCLRNVFRVINLLTFASRRG